MQQADIRKWNGKISATKRFYSKHQAYWTRLVNAYRLKFDIPGFDEDEQVKHSAWLKSVRQVDFENISETLQRAADDAVVNKMQAKPVVQQVIFDALFKYRGYAKMGYNPPGNDAVAPYVSNDIFEPDFPYVTHVPSENLYFDPFVKPHSMGTAMYAFEEMVVPLAFAKADERFVNRSQMKAYGGPDSDRKISDFLDQHTADGGDTKSLERAPDSEDERSVLEELMKLEGFVLLTEVHDRVNKRRITFANDVEQPVEDEEHPFVYREPKQVTNPITGLLEMMPGESGGEDDDTGFLVKNGFPYLSIAFDASDKWVGVPLMGYSNDLQNLVVESLSRRIDILDRGKTLVLVTPGAKVNNTHLPDDLKSADDMEVMEVSDVNEVREITLGHVPAEQNSIENDARGYLSQLLDVGAGNSNTATEAAAMMSDSELNRQWFQTPVQELYTDIVTNAFAIMGDPRYTPERWLLNVSKEGEPPVDRLLEGWWLQGRFSVDIETGSASILVEQLRRNDVLELAQWLRNDPSIDQKQLLEMVTPVIPQEGHLPVLYLQPQAWATP